MGKKYSNEELLKIAAGEDPESLKEMEKQYLTSLLGKTKEPNTLQKIGAALQDIAKAGAHVRSAGTTPFGVSSMQQLGQQSRESKRDALMKLFQMGQLKKKQAEQKKMETAKTGLIEAQTQALKAPKIEKPGQLTQAEQKAIQYGTPETKQKILQQLVPGVEVEKSISPEEKDVMFIKKQQVTNLLKKGDEGKAAEILKMSPEEYKKYLKEEGTPWYKKLFKTIFASGETPVQNKKEKYKQYRGM